MELVEVNELSGTAEKSQGSNWKRVKLVDVVVVEVLA